MESVRQNAVGKRLRGVVGAGLKFFRKRCVSASHHDGAVILMYHSVAGPDLGRWVDPTNRMDPVVFRQQMQFLAKYRRVISLIDLVNTLAAGERPRSGTVVITFDDGYVDNLRVAFPLLDELGLPATLFLPTAYIDNTKSLWIDELYSLFQTRSRHVVELDGDRDGERFRLDRKSERLDAYARLSALMFNATYVKRSQLLGMLRQQVKPTVRHPRVIMTWAEVARLRERFPLVDVGSHSVTHRDLSCQPDVVVEEELVASKRTIEEHLNSDVRFFAYPYNRVGEAARRYLSVAGYQGGVASGDKSIGLEVAVSQLPRRAAPRGRLAFRSAA
jgi:peptidoglycan/xylan/chitin deacetylase (PgdA/CDA1 family)